MIQEMNRIPGWLRCLSQLKIVDSSTPIIPATRTVKESEEKGDVPLVHLNKSITEYFSANTATNRRTGSGIVYDAEGNLTSMGTFDGEGWLTSSGGVSYLYNGNSKYVLSFLVFLISSR